MQGGLLGPTLRGCLVCAFAAWTLMRELAFRGWFHGYVTCAVTQAPRRGRAHTSLNALS